MICSTLVLLGVAASEIPQPKLSIFIGSFLLLSFMTALGAMSLHLLTRNAADLRYHCSEGRDCLWSRLLFGVNMRRDCLSREFDKMGHTGRFFLK